MASEYPFEGTLSRSALALQDYEAIGDGRSVALIGLSQAAIAWLIARIGDAGAKVCFRLDGTPVPPVQEKGLPGYRDSKPVVTGNAAGSQNQYGVYGDIFEAVSQFVESGNILDQRSAVILASIADECGPMASARFGHLGVRRNPSLRDVKG